MDANKLRELVHTCHESSKLDFKLKMHEIKLVRPTEQSDIREWTNNKEMQWAELVKDLVSLVNGNVGTWDKTGYLIVGAGDEIRPDGTRHLQDVVSDELPTRREILDKFNSYCNPYLPGIECSEQELDGRKLFVVEIPPSPYLHRLRRDLKTPRKSFSPHVVLIRRTDGEEIYEASPEEQEIIREEKRRLTQGENMSGERIAISIEVYDRRIEVYRFVRDFLFMIQREGTIKLEQLGDFVKKTDEIIFLFDASIADYIQEIYRQAVQLYSTDKQLSNSRISEKEEISRIAKENSDLLIWLSDQPDALRKRLYNYISF
ncbi:MAG: hypothetical protein RLZZ511_2611 [Cyanobacteriota bacterium]|jgi:hypothetical protein